MYVNLYMASFRSRHDAIQSLGKLRQQRRARKRHRTDVKSSNPRRVRGGVTQQYKCSAVHSIVGIKRRMSYEVTNLHTLLCPCRRSAELKCRELQQHVHPTGLRSHHAYVCSDVLIRTRHFRADAGGCRAGIDEAHVERRAGSLQFNIPLSGVTCPLMMIHGHLVPMKGTRLHGPV